VLVRIDGEIVGCVGVTGDSSDNDELAARAGIAAAGLTGDPSKRAPPKRLSRNPLLRA
jgi:hypothetical protein